MNLLIAIISGAENTPYENGIFEYHIYLPPDYPQSPPKCNLETTGENRVRFNPNLYSSGKVCLSLLGTWKGKDSENWDPKLSSLLQLLISIQSVIMSDYVYFNEPGYEEEINSEDGWAKNEGYSNIIRVATLQYAIINQIKKPPQGFEEIVRTHFYLKKETILETVANWMNRS